MNRMRVVTEKTKRGWWRVRIVETDWSAVKVGWELEAMPDWNIFVKPCSYETNFPSRKAARESLRRYTMHNCCDVRITGGLH